MQSSTNGFHVSAVIKHDEFHYRQNEKVLIESAVFQNDHAEGRVFNANVLEATNIRGYFRFSLGLVEVSERL